MLQKRVLKSLLITSVTLMINYREVNSMKDGTQMEGGKDCLEQKQLNDD